MTELELRADELAQNIKKSTEYNQYHTLLNQIKEDEELFGRVNEFRRKNFILSLENQNAFDEMMSLRQEYESVLAMEIVKDFLAAEQRLAKQARSINDIVVAAFDLDVDFLDQ